jgi:hypothetical protein
VEPIKVIKTSGALQKGMYAAKDGEKLMRAKAWPEAAAKFAEALAEYKRAEREDGFPVSGALVGSAESSRVTALNNAKHGTEDRSPDAAIKEKLGRESAMKKWAASKKR